MQDGLAFSCRWMMTRLAGLQIEFRAGKTSLKQQCRGSVGEALGILGCFLSWVGQPYSWSCTAVADDVPGGAEKPKAIARFSIAKRYQRVSVYGRRCGALR